ncbi:hypothetical protein PTTG_03194 [Puccinia triticina 1-1 BBBD Race 1]|uniref:Uncharacterized protein n=1 Tax=Puccinia triticina (isolate 1-1 / race 1 (BBBD)) TaxID=630390 RepID=A0A180H0D6_PUCT1|nr:hypothetical protein PTTG_03194 [Puccinia triticina 1-1 BBBD Race 1]WAR62900.1 hypothetical protein PtB15_15B488 [Puccinia triticina]
MDVIELLERLPGCREAAERMKKTQEILSLVDAFEALADKHSIEPDQPTPAKKDPGLAIKDMGGKAETFEKIHSTLLPSIRDQLACLQDSLDLLDPQKNPHPATDPTLECLSSLDNTLESILAAIGTLTLESPLPDEKHDHGLEMLKVFRCSHLQETIQKVVGSFIYEWIFRDVIPSFIRWCAMANIGFKNDSMSKKGSDLRQGIQIAMSYPHDQITQTIDWCRKSDWAIVQEAWLEASDSCEEALEKFTCRINRTIQSTSDADLDSQNHANRVFIVGVAKSAIPLIKLARILIKKTSEKISKKHLATLGITTLELNSETMTQLYDAPQPLFGLAYLANILYLLDSPILPITIPAEKQTQLRGIAQKLPTKMESTLAVIESCLIPLLTQIEDQDSPEAHLESFLPILRQTWGKASEHLRDIIFSFEVERIAI